MNPNALTLTLSVETLRLMEAALVELPFKQVANAMAEFGRAYADAVARANEDAAAKAKSVDAIKKTLPPVGNAA